MYVSASLTNIQCTTALTLIQKSKSKENERMKKKNENENENDRLFFILTLIRLFEYCNRLKLFVYI